MSFLLSNYFILIIFKLYLNIKYCIQVLSDINFNSIENFNFNSLRLTSKSVLFSQSYNTRSFSTFTKNNNINDLENNALECNSDKYLQAQEIKQFKKVYGGGYLGYKKINNFGNVYQFVDLENSSYSENLKGLSLKLKGYTIEIPENIIYSILPVLRFESSEGVYTSLSVSDSIKISRSINTELLADTLIKDIKNILREYSLRDQDLDLFIMGRPWLSVDEFNIDRYLDRENLTHVFNKVIENKLSAWSKSLNIKNSSDKIIRLKDYEYKDNYMDNYGAPIYDKNNNLIGYKTNNNKYLEIYTFYNENNLLSNKVLIKDFDKVNKLFTGDVIESWIDTRTETGFTREYKKNTYYYDNNNNFINSEIKYSYPSFPLHKKEVKQNEKIGSLDLETYGSDIPNLGSGYHQVYAGGWATTKHKNYFYIKKNETSEQFVNRLLTSILMTKDLNGFTFYVHNLGRFDSIFIIKSLILNDQISITPIWKDNAILSLTLKYGDFKIVLLDSLQLISDSLENILKSFNCEVQKGYFPHTFVNKDNLYYIGDKPSKFYFKNIPELEYNNIPINNWDLQKELIKYLKSDVEGLLDVVLKFNNNIYSKYQLNITNFKTISSLALAVYRSSYIPSHLSKELKMIKGELENEIRTSYFGGNVDVYVNEVTRAYYYDINSQYSKAMLNDMPLGDPVLSSETDLNKIFGFVFAEIYCPSENVLRVPFIQYRDPLGKMNECPRGKFKRLIFSEEAKYALKYGYSIKVEYCYQFKRGKGLFNDYINDHYEIKLKSLSKDPVQYSLSKLFLNSLYGRMGMKDLSNTMKIVDKREAEYLDKTYNVSIFSELSDNKYLVKFSGKLSESVLQLYSKELEYIKKDKTYEYTKEQLKKSGLNKKIPVPSAVHIAAAITSYARIIINEYKNIPGNPCIMSDTDSAVLPYPLPGHLVGKEIGQMKLEQVIEKGIFIRKKLYYIKNSNNQEIIRASGIDSSNLNYELFLKLLQGETITIERTDFNVDWENFNINVVSSDIVIQGLNESIKTLYNTPDVNFKFISFPIKYNIIIHPKFPITSIYPTTIKNFKNKSSKFSYLEIFIYFIFILSYLAFITFFIYKIY